MAENNTDLEKIVVDQGKQIKKLIAASVQTEKRMIMLDKKMARQSHTIRNQTNLINSIMRTLHKGGG